MSLQTWVETLVSANADGPSVSNSSSATSILPVTAKYTFPANYFYVGRSLRIRGMGRISNIVTTPGTITLDFRLGGTVVFNGAAMQMSTTVHTTVPIWFEVNLTCRAVGSTGNFMGQGLAYSQALNISGADSTQSHTVLMMPNSTPAVGTNFDTTTTQAIDFFTTFSIANAGNLIQLHQFTLEALN